LTVTVAPPGIAYEQIPPQYATREHVEMVSPGYIRHSLSNGVNGCSALCLVYRYLMHISDSAGSISATINVSHQSHLLRLRILDGPKRVSGVRLTH